MPSANESSPVQSPLIPHQISNINEDIIVQAFDKDLRSEELLGETRNPAIVSHWGGSTNLWLLPH